MGIFDLQSHDRSRHPHVQQGGANAHDLKVNPFRYQCGLLPLTERFLFLFSPSSLHEVALDKDTRIQILDSLPSLAGARPNQMAAFIRSERALAVWSDDVSTLVDDAASLNRK